MDPKRRYFHLYEYLRHCGQTEISLSLQAIEKLLGRPLPASARRNPGWWSNRKQMSQQSAAWIEAGYETSRIDLVNEEITFREVLREGYSAVGPIDAPEQWNATTIRELRSHLGVTQAELADILGVRQQTISEWETNAYRPTRATAKYLSIVAERSGFKRQNQ